MNKRFAGVIGLVLVGVVSVGAIATQSSAQASPGPSSKRVQNLTTALHITAVNISNPGGLSALKIGDTLTETNTQTVRGKQVATNVLACTVGNVDAQYFESVCTLVVKFAKGDLHLQGYVLYPVGGAGGPGAAPLVPYHFAVVGGTGFYQSASGEMVGMDQPNGPGKLKYRIILK